MKKTLLSCLLSLALCMSVIGGAAYAEESDTAVQTTTQTTVEAETQSILPPVYTWGTVEIQEDGSLYLTNDDTENIYNEVIVRISEETAIVDAETGNPMNSSELEDGSVLHVWLGNAMTMSLPPQAIAMLIVANVPEGSEVPQFYQITEADYTYDDTDSSITAAALKFSDGSELEVSNDTVLVPYKTKNIVGLDSLIPETKILVWNDADENIEKVMVFANEYNTDVDTDGDETVTDTEDNTTSDPNEETEAQPSILAPVLAWGTVDIQEDGSLFITNDNPDVIHNEIIVRISEDTPIVDASTGESMYASDLQDGSTIYTWLGNAMTLSLPPQANAILVVANIPEGSEAPQFYQIIEADYTYDATDSSITAAALKFSDGSELEVSKDAVLVPYMTKNIVTMDSLIPGTRILVWNDADENIEKIMVFGYEYSGYMNIDEEVISVSGSELSVNGKAIDEMIYVPLRAVAEAAGFEVTWSRENGAGILHGEDEIISGILPDTESIQTPEGETMLSAKCVLDNDITYVPALDLAYFLNLF